jgi:hypothetical protein
LQIAAVYRIEGQTVQSFPKYLLERIRNEKVDLLQKLGIFKSELDMKLDINDVESGIRNSTSAPSKMLSFDDCILANRRFVEGLKKLLRVSSIVLPLSALYACTLPT